MINQWTLLAGLTAGFVLFIYNYVQREGPRREQGYGHRGPSYDYGTDDEFDSTTPPRAQNNTETRNLPSRDDECTICRDHLLRRNAERSYCIISLPGCGHWFHQACAMRLLEYHPLCPNCRVPIDRDSLRRTPVRVVDNTHDEVAQGDAASSSIPQTTNPLPSKQPSDRGDDSNGQKNPRQRRRTYSEESLD